MTLEPFEPPQESGYARWSRRRLGSELKCGCGWRGRLLASDLGRWLGPSYVLTCFVVIGLWGTEPPKWAMVGLGVYAFVILPLGSWLVRRQLRCPLCRSDVESA